MSQKLISIEKLKKFGWGYKTQLKEGLSKTYEFYQNQLNK